MKTFFCTLILVFSQAVMSASPIDIKEVCQDGRCFQLVESPDLYKHSEYEFRHEEKAVFKGEFLLDDKCYSAKNCFVFLGQVADAFSLSINGKLISDNLNTPSNYYSLDSIALPIPNEFLRNSKNEIIVEVKDVNGTNWGLLSKGMYVGLQYQTYFSQMKDWLFRTGFSLFSAYSLILFALTLLIFLYIRFDKNIIAILAYCLISAIYLLSFSEIPRKFFDPEIMSGLIHFPLRLSQDFMLFLVFQRMLNPKKMFNKLYVSIFTLYLFFISAFLILGYFHLVDYNISKLIIVIGAPLVAMPMGYAYFLSSKLPIGFERSVLMPICAILFILQLNDLVMFWQLADTYFAVKLYIPFVVATLLFIQLRRYFLEYTNKSLLAEKVMLTKQVAHDISSPLSALNLISKKLDMTPDYREVFEGAVLRIVNISRNLLEETSGQQSGNVISISRSIEAIVREKKEEFRKKDVLFQVNIPTEVLSAKGNEIEFSRALSNIINNAIEAYPEGRRPEISIDVLIVKNKIQIKILDTGAGIPKNILNRIGEYGFSFGKEVVNSGNGLGVFSAIRSVERWGGSFQIKSAKNIGTAVTLTLLKV